MLVEIDPAYFRPTEVDLLIGDPTKAKEKLGWEAQIDLEALVSEMVRVAFHNAQQKNPIPNWPSFNVSVGWQAHMVAGHKGMVGRAVLRRLEKRDCTILTAARDEVDLTRQRG